MRWTRSIATTLVFAALAGGTAAAFSSGASGKAHRGAGAPLVAHHAPASAPSAVAQSAAHHAPRVASPGPRLPAGVGRDIAERGCLICHSAMLIAQQHKDSTGWEKTVSLMQKWGAPVQGAERDTVMMYLREHCGSAQTH